MFCSNYLFLPVLRVSRCLQNYSRGSSCDGNICCRMCVIRRSGFPSDWLINISLLKCHGNWKHAVEGGSMAEFRRRCFVFALDKGVVGNDLSRLDLSFDGEEVVWHYTLEVSGTISHEISIKLCPSLLRMILLRYPAVSILYSIKINSNFHANVA